jgi:hypothetical protein
MIAVAGNPLIDVGILQSVPFVMKGGESGEADTVPAALSTA